MKKALLSALLALAVPGAAAGPDFTSCTDSVTPPFYQGGQSVFSGESFVPLCDGWVLFGDRVFDRISAINAFDGSIDSHFGLPGKPRRMHYVPSQGVLYVAMDARAELAKVDLVGNSITTIALPFVPWSFAAGTAGRFWVNENAATGWVYLINETTGLAEVSFNGDYSGEMVYDPANEMLLFEGGVVSDSFRQYQYNSSTFLITPVKSMRAADRAAAPQDRFLKPGGGSYLLTGDATRVLEVNTADPQDLTGSYNVRTTEERSAAWRLDGGMVAAADNQRVYFYDPVRRTAFQSVTINPTAGVGDGLRKVRFSRGGSTLLALGTEGAVTRLYYVRADQVATPTPTPVAAMIPPSAGCADAGIAAFSYTRAFDGVISDIAPLCDSWYLAGDVDGHRLLLVEAVTGETTLSVDLPAAPVKILVDYASGLAWVTLSRCTYIARVDLNTFASTMVPLPDEGGILSRGPGDDVLVTLAGNYDGNAGPPVRVLDGATSSHLGTLYPETSIGSMDFDVPGQVLFIKGPKTAPTFLNAYNYNAASVTLAAKELLGNAGSQCGSLHVSSDGQHLLLGCAAGALGGRYLPDYNTAALSVPLGYWPDEPVGVEHAAFSPGQGFVVAGTTTGDIKQYLADNYGIPALVNYGNYQSGFFRIKKLRYSKGGKALHLLMSDEQATLKSNVYVFRQSLQDGATWTPSLTPTRTISATLTPSPSASPTATISATFTFSPTVSPSPTQSGTWTDTPTPSATLTQSLTATGTATITYSPTLTATPSATPPWTPTPSASPTPTPTVTLTSTRTATPITRTELERPYPSPFRPEQGVPLRLDYTMREAGLVFLELFDLRGRRVRTLLRQDVGPGVHQALWDGTNDDGSLVASGLYLAVFRTGGVKNIWRVVVVR